MTLQCGWLAGVWPGLVLNSQGQGQGPGYPKVRVRVQGIQGSGSRISAGRLGKPWIDNLIWIYNCIPVHVCKLGPIVYQFMFRTLIVLSIEYRR